MDAGIGDPVLSQLEASALTPQRVAEIAESCRKRKKSIGVISLELRREAEAMANTRLEVEYATQFFNEQDRATQRAIVVKYAGEQRLPATTKWDEIKVQDKFWKWLDKRIKAGCDW